jgi:hypothetical protein
MVIALPLSAKDLVFPVSTLKTVGARGCGAEQTRL